VQVRYIIGVDGGGTGTRARLADATGRVLGQGEAGPSALGQGVDQAWRHVQQAVVRAFEAAALPLAGPQQCVLGLGLAGAHVGLRRDRFVAAAPPYALVVLNDDGTTSLFGALRGEPGAVIAAGTGSIGEALWPDGRRLTVGGWGFAIGDEGSGAWLGLRAMRLAHRAQDGRCGAGPLVRRLWQLAGSSREALLAWGEQAGQAGHAALAPLVFEMESEDPAAAALLRDAVQALESHAAALDPSGRLPLVVTGSLGQRLRPRLAPELLARCVEPAGDSADGALLLARLAWEGQTR